MEGCELGVRRALCPYVERWVGALEATQCAQSPGKTPLGQDLFLAVARSVEGFTNTYGFRW